MINGIIPLSICGVCDSEDEKLHCIVNVFLTKFISSNTHLYVQQIKNQQNRKERKDSPAM